MRSARVLVVLLAALSLLACGGGGASTQDAPKARGVEVASWLFASRGVILSWVDGKISPEAADKNLESTLEMLRRESSTAAGTPMAPHLAKAQTLLETARKAVQKDDKAAAIDAAASLSDVRSKLEP